MLTINVDYLSDMTVVECRGRIIGDESVFRLRDVVLAQAAEPAIMLDLSEVKAIGGAGLGMLAFLNHWAREHNLELKLFSPSKAVMEGLLQNGSIYDFEIVSFHELQAMMRNMMRNETHYPLAA